MNRLPDYSPDSLLPNKYVRELDKRIFKLTDNVRNGICYIPVGYANESDIVSWSGDGKLPEMCSSNHMPLVYVRKDGYIFEVYQGYQPGLYYQLQHQTAYLKAVGMKKLEDNVQIHHQDRDRKHNTLDNLKALTVDDHRKLHNWLRANTNRYLLTWEEQKEGAGIKELNATQACKY